LIFRSARHTNYLHALENFYVNVIGLTKLGSFDNHDGYNGIFLGKENQDWHLEFTETDEIVSHNFHPDDILVFYFQTKSEYNEILDNIKSHSIERITPQNPYWKENGIMILDPDGCPVVVSYQKI